MTTASPLDRRLASARTDVGYNNDCTPGYKRVSEKKYRRVSRRYSRDTCLQELIEMEEAERLDREEEAKAKLDADRYRALHAVEQLHKDLAAARDRFNATIQEHNLDAWLEVDMFEDYHSVITVEEYLEKQD